LFHWILGAFVTNLAVRKQSNALEITRHLNQLSSEDLRLFAVKAANERDFEKLWNLCLAYLTINSKKGGKLSKLTLRNYRGWLKSLLEQWQGENLLRPSRNAGAFFIRDLETTVREKTAKPYAPSSVGIALTTAKLLYKALHDANATEASPFEHVKATQDLVPAWEKRKPYSDEETEVLLEHADEAVAVMVLLGAHAGLRLSEMCSLRWKDIDWDKGKLSVVGKGGKKASVVMTARLELALKSLQSKPSPRKRSKRLGDNVLPWGNVHARQHLKDHCAACGVEYAEKAVHGLRHNAGTRYYAQTKDLGRVASHLRHENVNTTRIYAKLADRQIKDDIRNW
jgi:integrase/recombinase XerC